MPFSVPLPKWQENDGIPVPYKGKPIWEIVGNLRNLGVGRYIVEDEHKDRFIEPSFYKLVRVQPMIAPKSVGENRGVLVWAEYVLRGKKLSELEQLESQSCLTKFHLIPKEEEAKYLNGITDTPRVKVIPKYQQCPPLFQKLWELKQQKLGKNYDSLSKLPTIIDTGEKSFEVLGSDDTLESPPHSDLHKSDIPVEELYKRIYILRKKLRIEDKLEDS